MKKNKLNEKIVIWGASYQFKIIRNLILNEKSEIAVLIDDTPDLDEYLGYKVLNGIENFIDWFKGKNSSEYGFFICIGNPNGKIREKKANQLIKLGLTPNSIFANNVMIDDDVKLGLGLQVLENVVIHAGSIIGNYCIFNANSSVDHDCKLGNCVELAPGAVCAGRIELKNYAWMGTGSVVFADEKSKSYRIIGENSIVGAGSVVTKDVQDKTIVVGNPAKELRKI